MCCCFFKWAIEIRLVDQTTKLKEEANAFKVMLESHALLFIL